MASGPALKAPRPLTRVRSPLYRVHKNQLRRRAASIARKWGNPYDDTSGFYAEPAAPACRADREAGGGKEGACRRYSRQVPGSQGRRLRRQGPAQDRQPEEEEQGGPR